MAYKIIYTKLFLKKVIALNTYLETEWNIQVAKSFHEKLIHTILIISNQPRIGAPSQKGKNVRRILVTEHNRLYYRINQDDSIILLTFFDTRQNPEKNNYD